MAAERPQVLRDVRQRPLAIVGEVSPVIVGADGAVGVELGGGGFDAVLGVHKASGRCTAVLLASHEVPPAGAVLDRRGSNVAFIRSKGRFEAVAGTGVAALQPLRRWSEVQDGELHDVLDVHAAVLRAHHVHVSSQAWVPWVAFAQDAAWDHPPTTSASLRCSQVVGLPADLLDALPPLVFVDADCDREADGCDAIAAAGTDRIIVHIGGVATEVVVDSLTHVALAAGGGTNASALAGFTLVGIQAGLCPEEAVATALLHVTDGITPPAIVRLAPQERARRVTTLMPPHVPGQVVPGLKEAVAILVLRRNEILLGRKADGEGLVEGALYLPGGKLLPGEDFAAAAARELAEETGLTPGDLRVCGYSSYRHSRDFYRFVQYESREDASAAVAGDDLVAIEWQALDDIRRADVFPLTWTQLHLLASAGAFHFDS